jgi:hypothetical protein
MREYLPLTIVLQVVGNCLGVLFPPLRGVVRDTPSLRSAALANSLLKLQVLVFEIRLGLEYSVCVRTLLQANGSVCRFGADPVEGLTKLQRGVARLHVGSPHVG